MRMMLLAAAAFAAIALPAATQAQRVGVGIPDAKSPDLVAPGPFGGRLDLCREGTRRTDGHRRRDRGFAFACGLGGWAYADSGWAITNNRSWDPDSYNDWWNDRPDRAYPRWVQEQRGGPCSEDRMWWSGTGWHC